MPKGAGLFHTTYWWSPSCPTKGQVYLAGMYKALFNVSVNPLILFALLQFSIYVAYNLRLERRTLREMCGLLLDSSAREWSGAVSSSYGVVFPPPRVQDTAYSLCFPVTTRPQPAIGWAETATTGRGFDYKSLFLLNESPDDAQPLRPTLHYSHQQIVFMHSLCCRSTSSHCMPFQIHMIDFYSEVCLFVFKCLLILLQNDLTLGQFLEVYCFNTDYKCPNEVCQRSMLEHERAFIHSSGRLNVTVYEYKFDVRSRTLLREFAYFLI